MLSDTDTAIHGALELAELLRPLWNEFAHPAGTLVCEGKDDDDKDDDSDDDSGDDGDKDDKSKSKSGDDDGDKDKDPAAEAAKWKALARKHESQAKQNADKAKKYDDLEDSKKSEVQRATDKTTAAEKRADEAERKLLQIEVALDKAPERLPLAKVRGLSKRLTGSTREEFEADAEELFADFKPDTGDDDDEDAGDDKSTTRRPKEKMKPGAHPKAKAEETDPAKLADAVPPGW